ncbi:hypothetical protein SuUB82_17280 [Streptococcus uberis]|uniref:phage tail spike protein n=1 Tax=Streptococcus uberis TaxID=1349 RepID=UPI0033658BBC
MIYLFDKDEKLVKIVKNTAIKTALQKFALTNEHYISDRLDIDMKALSDADLSKIEYVAIQSMEDSHTFHYFWIAQKQNKANLTTIVSVQSGIEELQKTTVKDIRPKNKEARPVIDELLLGTNWTARFVEGVDVASATFYYISTFEALKKVCEIWGLEMQFFVEMNGNKVGGRYIDFKKKIGVRSGKRVVYGHNALEILQEIERTNIYTALIGRGKGEQVSADGYGRKITFADVVWDSPVAKPKGQEYVELPSMTALYGIKNANGTMRPKIGFVEFQEETDPATLLKRTYNHLVNVARPQVAFKTSAVYLKGVKIGDTVRVVRHDKKIDYETRIFEITFNRLNNKASDIKLGDNIRGTDSQNQAIQTSISNAIESTITSFVTKLPDFLPSADGFNSNWYTDSDPTLLYPGKVLINDLWFKPDSEFPGEYVMLRWTGEAWEEVIRTSDSVKFEDALAEVNAVIKDGDDALNQKYDEIVAKTISHDTLISQAQSTADSAKTDATTALSNIASESQKLTEQINALSKTEGDHYTATNQTLTQLDGTVKGLQTDYTALVNKDNEITQTLTNYKQTIDQNTASITENKQSVDGTISSLQTQVTQNKNDISTKASQLTVDNLSGRMSSAETTITQNANEISTRLSQTNIESLITSKATVITDNKVKETSESFSREITRVDGKIDGMSVGSVNYIVKSNKQFTDKGVKASGITVTVTDGILHVESVAGNGNYLNFDWLGRYLTPAENKFNEGDDFTITFWCKRISGTGNPNVYIKSGIGYYPLSGELNSTEFKPISYTGKWKKANVINLHLGFQYAIGVFEFEKLKLSKGNITTDWSPSPEDMVMLTSFNIVKDTVDSHTQQIGQQGSSLTTTIQKVDSIQTSVSNIDGRLSTVTQTADGLVTTVQNLSVGGRNYLTKSNLIKDSGTNKLNALSVRDAETPNGFKVTGNSTKDGMVRIYNVINSDGWWTVSFDIKGSQSLAVNVDVDICDQGQTRIWTNATNTYERKSISVNVTNYSKNPSVYHFVDFSNFAFAHFWIDNIKIEKGNMPTDYSQALEDTDAKISAVQTTVTQTANSWAVKNLTSNGSILGQINLTDGTVKIDGKYVKITGQTLIDNGIITNAMIKDLTADKIIGGTIDANKISVINLNASNITSGQISGGLIKGGVLTALNGAMSIDLNNGTTEMYNDNPAIRRVTADLPNQFIKFSTGTQPNDNNYRIIGSGTKSNLTAAITSIGTNRLRTENNLDGGFTGINIYAGGSGTGDSIVDRVEISSDILKIAHSANSSDRGWVFENINGLNNQYVFRPNTTYQDTYKAMIGTSLNPVDEMYINEMYIKGQRLGYILKDIANRIGNVGSWAAVIS